MEDQDTSGNLEMRITELENQLRELREAQQSMGAQAGSQAAIPCGYCYCSYCYCYAAGGQEQAAAPASIPCMMGLACQSGGQQAMGAQAAAPCTACIPCAGGTQVAGIGSPVLFCRICTICTICTICINECICGPCNICGFTGGGGLGGGGNRFGGLGG